MAEKLWQWCVWLPYPITGGCLNTKMSFYQYRDPHVTTVLPLTWESPYLGKTVFILKWGQAPYYQYNYESIGLRHRVIPQHTSMELFFDIEIVSLGSLATLSYFFRDRASDVIVPLYSVGCSISMPRKVRFVFITNEMFLKYVDDRIPCDTRVVFIYLLITQYHYHYYAEVLETIEHTK